MAGFWDQMRRIVTQVAAGSRPASRSSTSRRAPRWPVVSGGPDACALVSDDEIEAATGHRPVGPGDPKGGGSQTDIGLFKVCEWRLTGGDEFLTNVTVCRDQAAVDLARSRNWNEETPFPGLGDLARYKVDRNPRGNTELHLSAYKGRYALSFVHTSTVPKTKADIEPLKALMAAVLARLD
jgi:hypothetical protein